MRKNNETQTTEGEAEKVKSLLGFFLVSLAANILNDKIQNSYFPCKHEPKVNVAEIGGYPIYCIEHKPINIVQHVLIIAGLGEK